MGEHKLDRALKSLLNLIEKSISERDYKNPEVTRLIQESHFNKVIQGSSRQTKQLFKLQRKGKDFSFTRFASQNNIQFNDLLSGTLPMVFRDYRRVIHCLKLSWALYLTCKMKGLHLRTRQRRRGSQWTQPTSQNSLSTFFVHLYVQLRNKSISEEKDIIKCFKTSLCYLVSESMGQTEFPQGDRIEIVPTRFLPEFNSFSQDFRVNLYFCFLQSKVLCQEVPKTFIQETLEKHRKQLSTPHKGIDDQTLQLLYEEGKQFGKIVKQFYKPNTGFFPTNKATFQFPRKTGGMKGDLVFNKVLANSAKPDPLDRPEPFVIGLFGQPGQGKSLLLNRIKNLLRPQFPGTAFNDLCYVRTCNCDHWDGYTGQPITILDDLGQSLKGSDIQEFITLVSCNPYIVPMASLESKGTYFNSEIIITTSNLPYGMQLDAVYRDQSGIIDDLSFWRRFHLPLIVEDNQILSLKTEPNWVRPSNLIPKRLLSSRMTQMLAKANSLRSNHLPSARKLSAEDWEIRDWKSCQGTILSMIGSRRDFHENHRNTWTQKVFAVNQDCRDMLGEEFYSDQIIPLMEDSSDEESSEDECEVKRKVPLIPKTVNEHFACLNFDAYPPEGPLEVRVEPIVEPLKVRTITAGRGSLFCLKPFQRAMWQALGESKQYVLTHGTNNLEPAIERLYAQSAPEDVWISGDYSAATDSFAIEASKALLEGILSEISHEPTKRWAMKEISPHLLVYPKESGLKPVLQESGQLMGSFLSFPLLCLLNNCTAKFSGLTPDQYLINGDDILMRAPAETYPLWKKTVDQFGLSLSLGKNYVSPIFGTINSQLIKHNEVQQSGKQKLLDRRVQVLGECLRDLELQMDTNTPEEVQELFKVVNRKKLSRTCRSIRVPSSHGGLALSWGPRPKSVKSLRTEILVYLHQLFDKLKGSTNHISFPYLSVGSQNSSDLEQMERAFNEPVSNKEYHEDFLSRVSLTDVSENVKKHPQLRECFFNKDIESLPPLNFIQCKLIPFYKEDREVVQQQINSAFLSCFLKYEGSHNYDLFRKRILKTHLGIQKEVIPKEYLVNLYDLEFPCDFLDEINFFERTPSQCFDSKLFESKLGSSLRPKDFDLPRISAADFSREVVNDYNVLQEICIHGFDERHERYGEYPDLAACVNWDLTTQEFHRRIDRIENGKEKKSAKHTRH